MNNPPTLHLCDFDGTLTWHDSLPRFLWFVVPTPQLVLGSILFVFNNLWLFFTFRWSKSTAKEALFACFFKGKTQADMQALGQAFCSGPLPSLLRRALLDNLRQHQRNGHTVAIVSASPDLWLRPFCVAEGFDLLCTELAYAPDKKSGESRFSGRFATPNCTGEEKVERIRARYRLSDFTKISAYGNSKGDEAMYTLATDIYQFTKRVRTPVAKTGA